MGVATGVGSGAGVMAWGPGCRGGREFGFNSVLGLELGAGLRLPVQPAVKFSSAGMIFAHALVGPALWGQRPTCNMVALLPMCRVRSVPRVWRLTKPPAPRAAGTA